MVTPIQPRVTPAAPALSPAAAVTFGDKAVAMPAAADSQPAVVMQPPKAAIHVDTETMRRNLQEAITRINDLMRDGGRGLNFSIDHAVGGPVVQVRNLESGEVIRQIPNEVVVRVAHSIEDLKGMLHNEAV